MLGPPVGKLPEDREAIGQGLGSAEPTKKPGVMGMGPVNYSELTVWFNGSEENPEA